MSTHTYNTNGFPKPSLSTSVQAIGREGAITSNFDINRWNKQTYFSYLHENPSFSEDMNNVNQLRQTFIIKLYLFPQFLIWFVLRPEWFILTFNFQLLNSWRSRTGGVQCNSGSVSQTSAVTSQITFYFLKVISAHQFLILLKINTTNINATHALSYDLICLT